ncbi:MAG: TrmH family RNA methyltransferase [Merdibacter sp.]
MDISHWWKEWKTPLTSPLCFVRCTPAAVRASSHQSERQTATGILVKASAGASEYLPWISYGSPQEILDQLQEQQIPLLCAERKDSVSLYNYTFPARFCIAIGGEMRGLSKAIKAASVQNICIPYGREVRNALNAESATAVIAFEILRQRLSGNPG